MVAGIWKQKYGSDGKVTDIFFYRQMSADELHTKVPDLHSFCISKLVHMQVKAPVHSLLLNVCMHPPQCRLCVYINADLHGFLDAYYLCTVAPSSSAPQYLSLLFSPGLAPGFLHGVLLICCIASSCLFR